MNSLEGKRFGKLLVIDRASSSGAHFRYNCLCDCGNTSIVFGSNLLRGHTISCGCWHKSHAVTHGKSKHSAFRCWQSMKERCLNPKHEAWDRYGGRGITIHEDWLNHPEKFFDYIGDRPTLKHTVDRIDGNGNYEPSNIRWATPSEQMANAKSSKNICINGETKNLRQWGIAIGVSRAAIKSHSKTRNVSLADSVLFYIKQRAYPLATIQQTQPEEIAV